MKKIKMPMWLAGLAAVSASLVSCDPVSSVDYKLYNKTSDTVTVAMYKEILSSSYGGFAIVESDSVTTYYGEADSVNVAVLAPNQWDSEPVWHLETEGGKRFEGESRYYILTLRDK